VQRYKYRLKNLVSLLDMKWHIIPKDLHPSHDSIRKIQIDHRNLCLVRNNDVFYVTGAKCPHAGADLSKGWCENNLLICPYHRHGFDLQTGKGLPSQGNYIHSYEVKWENNECWVHLPSRWWPW
jgi:nitrite reductase/ring-hydroxylating ferredoxin subunit